MEAIVNVSADWGIGFENCLLVAIRADLRRFRALTEGKTVILGRKTLETFPNGKPLKNRRNIILSANPTYFVEGAEVAHGLEELKALLYGTPTDAVAVIGGETIYRLLLPYCTAARVTKTLQSFPADRFFPNLDALPRWERSSVSDVMEENGVRFQYLDYVNHDPLPL